MNARASVLIAGVASGLLLCPAESRACGACMEPELWGVQVVGGDLAVVTNFGLLRQGDAGAWTLTCEEEIGGLLLSVHGGQGQLYASTDTGVFAQQDGFCDWRAGPSSESNEWVVAFSVPAAETGDVTSSFALTASRDGATLRVERALDDGDLLPVAEFPSERGYRQLVSGGDPVAVFVSGYQTEPRRFSLAFSLDAGESWDETEPEVDNETSTWSPILVDPRRPHALLLHAETVPGVGHQIWQFDALDKSVALLLHLEDQELLGGVALGPDQLWVAGQHRGGGSLYRASRDELVFARVVEETPVFDCLGAHDGVLYSCVDDFSYGSEFLVARSDDGGEEWQAMLSVEDLVSVKGCGAGCATTLEWLRGSYDIEGADAPTVDSDAGAAREDGTAPDTSVETEPPRSASGCNVTAGSVFASSWWALLTALATGLVLGKRRRVT